MKNKDNFLLFFSFAIFLFSVVSICHVFVEIRDFSITGHATSEGVVNLSINPSSSVNFISSDINWGSGRVVDGDARAILDSEGNVINGTWGSSNDGFVVRNSGNLNLRLNLTMSKNANNFIGGTGASYMYKVSNVEDGACTPPAGFNLGVYYEVGASTLICDSFQVGKSINIDLRLVVPSDSSVGNLTDIVTISYESV